jgi:hypothetical protein
VPRVRRAPTRALVPAALLVACGSLAGTLAACELAYPLNGYAGEGGIDGSAPDRAVSPQDAAVDGGRNGRDAHVDRSVAVDGSGASDAQDAADASDAKVHAETSHDGGGCGRFVRGPAMVPAGSICIDSTEVTQAQYQSFLSARGADAGGQKPECSWNTDWKVDTAKCTFDPSGMADYPVVGIDFCDAAGFCAWAGKRLCGLIGGGVVPGTTDAGVLDNPGQSEWVAACSHDGMHEWPYGNTFKPNACNGGEHSGTPRTTVPVGTTPGCVGGYPGIYDMAGNVHEWEDACDNTSVDDSGASDICAFRGGSYHDTVKDSCFTDYAWARSMVDCDIGIRCCADP